MPDKATPTTALQSTAVVLAFDPAGRQSSRRQSQQARARRHERRAERKQLKAEAESLGMTPDAFEADADLHAHYEAVRKLEAAYRIGATEGRCALLDIISSYFEQGHETGLDDARVGMRHQIIAAGRFQG